MAYRRLFLIFLATLSVGTAQADGLEHSIVIPGWSIETSEKGLKHRMEYPYPIWNLVDGNPKTTWVYSAKDYPKPTHSDDDGFLPGNYFIKFDPDKATVLDELRITTGYNKSEALYYRNSRPVEVQIFEEYPYDWKDDGTTALRVKPLRTVSLTDKPGEKSIRLPKRKYHELYVVFSKIRRGPIDDLCVSEIMPRAGGRNAMPRLQSFLYTPGGGCCGGEFELRSLRGPVTAIASYEAPIFAFSTDGQYVAGVRQMGDTTTFVWVANLKTGRKLWTGKLPSKGYVEELKWSRNQLTVPISRNDYLNESKPAGNLFWKAK